MYPYLAFFRNYCFDGTRLHQNDSKRNIFFSLRDDGSTYIFRLGYRVYRIDAKFGSINNKTDVSSEVAVNSLSMIWECYLEEGKEDNGLKLFLKMSAYVFEGVEVKNPKLKSHV